MRLSVDIYTNEDRVGSIVMEDEKFTPDPADSALLRNILSGPVFVMVDGELEDVHAEDDPTLFMNNLAKHYKSQGLRATIAEDRP